MAVNLAAKATKDLETIVANCVRLKRTADPRYAAANAILETRRTGEYNLDKTIGTIREHGKLRSFLSYKDIADASGLNWAKSRHGVFKHLDDVCRHAFSREWPNLTAIIVNKDHVATGEMTPENAKGFLRAFRTLGREVDIDDGPFIKREQQRVFAWCQEEH